MSIKRRYTHSVTFYDRSKAYNGYTLFWPKGGEIAWLIDMQGKVVHYWQMQYPPGLHGVLLHNGNLLGAAQNRTTAELGWPDGFSGIGGLLLEVDWEGKLVWEYDARYQGHDFCRLSSGNTLYISWDPEGQVPPEYAAKIKGGLSGTENKGVMWGDVLREVNPDGKEVWNWFAYEHLDPEIDSLCPLEGRRLYPCINSVFELPNKDILISSRHTNSVHIIDKATGDVKWRWGRGKIALQHDATMLDNGNILLFDNGAHREGFGPTYARVVEVNPSTDKIEWEYKSDPPSDFYTAVMGGCERLPNGNTLICESIPGRVFEVTRTGEMVWEFINPVYSFNQQDQNQMKRTIDPAVGGETLNAIFRAHRYAPDYPGLKGRDLEPKKFEMVNRIYGPESFKKETKPDAQQASQQPVTIRKPGRTYNGYTLFSPLGGKDAWLLDMQGNVAHRWKMPCPPGLHGELLPNGNLLYAGRVNDAPLPDFEGAGGVLLEVDWDGNTIWKYEDKYMHHGFYRMRNGNTMIFKWVPVPEDIAAKVNGGLDGSELNGVMWTDSIQEINARGKVVWEWVASEHLDPVADFICPLCPRSEWTHANGCSIMADGNILVSFSRLHNLAIIDRASGKIKWMWGRNEIAHQNNPTFLDGGNILLLDNGVHTTIYPMGFSRALEIDPKNNEMVWAYEDSPRSNFYSSIMGSCQRLPNGNTLICETTTGRIFEVSPKRDIVWEFNSPFFYQSHTYGRNNYVARAYRYGLDYAGLKGNIKPVREDMAQIKQVSTPRTATAVRVRKRLDSLGY